MNAMSDKRFFNLVHVLENETGTNSLTLSQTTNFKLFQTQGAFADGDFNFDENGRKFSKWAENTVGKRRNCSL